MMYKSGSDHKKMHCHIAVEYLSALSRVIYPLIWVSFDMTCVHKVNMSRIRDINALLYLNGPLLGVQS